jgi:hypothetical protein
MQLRPRCSTAAQNDEGYSISISIERRFVMKLNVKAVAIAQGAVAGILFVLCRLVFTLAPDGTLAAMKYLLHTDWSGVAVPVTWGGFFLGLVVFTVFAALVGAAWASIYNRLAGESRVASAKAITARTERLAYQTLHLE